MQRLLVASLAFLLLLLPFQVGGASVASAMPCCPCSGMPSCPPTCPTPMLACTATVASMVLPGEVEAAAPRAEEATPAPRLMVEEVDTVIAQRNCAGVDARVLDDPPNRSDGQALLRVFRI